MRSIDIAASYRQLADRSVEAITKLLERGEKEGHTPALATREVARALAAMNGAYLLDLVARNPEFDAETALEALYTVWSRTTWPDHHPDTGPRPTTRPAVPADVSHSTGPVVALGDRASAATPSTRDRPQ